ncbi:unnamed protein product [Chrysoparadoxa australica]
MAWQRDEKEEGADALILLEHNSVYTLGRGSTEANIKFDHTSPECPHEVVRVERGGEVTWHGPGQLVVYPVLDLKYHKQDLHWYLRQLEEVIIGTLDHYGLKGERDEEHTGVWVGGAKVAAIGLNASRWVTTHGFALNVCPDMTNFEGIVPCGIKDRPVSSMKHLLPEASSVDDVRQTVLAQFQEQFDVDYIEQDAPSPSAFN